MAFVKKFTHAFILTRFTLELLHVNFHKFIIRVIAFDLCQNFVSVHYLEYELMDFHQIWHMH